MLTLFAQYAFLISVKCSPTAFTHQYIPLNALHNKHVSQNFTVIGVPCNQFGGQEPGANHTEIMNGLKYVRPGSGFVPDFPILKKTKVNGEDEHPLYTYLKCLCPAADPTLGSEELYWKPYRDGDIRWNFGKFIIDKRGIPIYRFHPRASVDFLAPYVEEVLKN